MAAVSPHGGAFTESKVPERVARGESGEKEGKDVSDLSEAAMEEAELQACEGFRDLGPRTVDERYDLTDVVLC